MTRHWKHNEDAGFESSDDELSIHDGDGVDWEEGDSHRGPNDKDEENKPVDELLERTRTDTNRMQLMKGLMVLSIGLVALAVAFGANFILLDEEEDDFLEKYANFVDTIKDTAHFHVGEIQDNLQAFSRAITAAAIQGNATWPLVAPGMFEVLGHSTRQNSGIEALMFSPIVQATDVPAWSTFAVTQGNRWLRQSHQLALQATTSGNLKPTDLADGFISPDIVELDDTFGKTPSNNPPFLPMWMHSPPYFNTFLINTNVGTPETFRLLELSHNLRSGVTGPILKDPSTIGRNFLPAADHEAMHANFVDFDDRANGEQDAWSRPHGYIVVPVYSSLYDADNSPIVGMVRGLVSYERFLADLLPGKARGVTCVLKNTCGQIYTYELNGKKATYKGEGDLHDREWDHMHQTVLLHSYENITFAEEQEGHCLYSFELYPTFFLVSQQNTDLATYMTVAAIVPFFLMAFAFFAYDWFVNRRNSKVLAAAIDNGKIVSSLFPQNVRDRLIAENKAQAEIEEQVLSSPSRAKLQQVLNMESSEFNDGLPVGGEEGWMYSTKPIADHFPETTVMFADIAGFTKWSSTRKPEAVFQLLETFYKAFDSIAKRRKVFKVETIGDCYVAVTGIPTARRDHATAMVKFARECLQQMHILRERLVPILGDDTKDLDMRFGLHSGPVTGGVLRGDKSRFQLFGDTMNTAARMESNGERGRIHISPDTKDLLHRAGKAHWVQAREDKITAKGKGEMQTYWIMKNVDDDMTQRECALGEDNTERYMYAHSGGSGHSEALPQSIDSQLRGSLKKAFSTVFEEATSKEELDSEARVVERMLALLSQIDAIHDGRADIVSIKQPYKSVTQTRPHISPLQRMQPTIQFPGSAGTVEDLTTGPLSIRVETQLMEMIQVIKGLYDGPGNSHVLRSFEHACHVTEQMDKILKTLPVTSLLRHPMVHLATLFAALIRDINHPGVSNDVYGQKNHTVAFMYQNQSLAEQAAIDMGRHVFYESSFADLREFLFGSSNEEELFEQVILHAVLATDLGNKGLDDARKSAVRKWKQLNKSEQATLQLEYLMQAGDLSYVLMEDLLKGRRQSDVIPDGFNNGLEFFQACVLPLAKQVDLWLPTMHVLNVAERNFSMWKKTCPNSLKPLHESAET